MIRLAYILRHATHGNQIESSKKQVYGLSTSPAAKIEKFAVLIEFGWRSME